MNFIRPSTKSVFSLTTQLVVTIISGIIAAAVPITAFYLLWSWCMAQIPITMAYATLIKLGVTLALLLVGGGTALTLAIIGGVLVAAFVLALLD